MVILMRDLEHHFRARRDFTANNGRASGSTHARHDGLDGQGEMPAPFYRLFRGLKSAPVYVAKSYDTIIGWITPEGDFVVPNVTYSISTTGTQGEFKTAAQSLICPVCLAPALAALPSKGWRLGVHEHDGEPCCIGGNAYSAGTYTYGDDAAKVVVLSLDECADLLGESREEVREEVTNSGEWKVTKDGRVHHPKGHSRGWYGQAGSWS